MTTDERVDKLEEDLKTVRDQLIQAHAAFKVSCWWGGGLTALLLAFLGYTTLWDIPNRVAAYLAKQPEAQTLAQAKFLADGAEKAAARIQKMESDLVGTDFPTQTLKLQQRMDQLDAVSRHAGDLLGKFRQDVLKFDEGFWKKFGPEGESTFTRLSDSLHYGDPNK